VPQRVHRYGPDADTFLELTVPEATGPAPVAIVLHGGFWRAAYGIELARPLAADLAGAGFAAVAVEYRRVGRGGGWPTTLADVAAAVDCLPSLPEADRLDLTDVTVIGHSAGGHLAAWLAGRGRLPDGAPVTGTRRSAPTAPSGSCWVGVRSTSRSASPPPTPYASCPPVPRSSASTVPPTTSSPCSRASSTRGRRKRRGTRWRCGSFRATT
jgi:pimeloyl-ACP methyl ester carboxylesterase